jgi:hypothetical protein
VLPDSVPVNLIMALLCSSVVDPFDVSRESDVLATAIDTYPLIADSNFSKLLFVLVPQDPEFSPVACNSKFNELENVDAILSP